MTANWRGGSGDRGESEDDEDDDDEAVRSGSATEPSKAMIAAATRFKEAWDAEVKRSADGHILSDREIVEMHEAALALIWATGTTCLQDALDVLHDFES